MMNKTEFVAELQKRFPEYVNMSDNDYLCLVKEYLPKEYRDHSKNLIKEAGAAFIFIKEEAGKVWCNILSQGYIKYYHCKKWNRFELFPAYHTVDSYDTLLKRLIVDKQVGEI
jgi:hypothetical protein